MHADIAGAPHKIVNHRPVQELKPARAACFSDYDLGDIVRSRKVDDVIRNAPPARKRRGDAAETFGKAQRIGNAVAFHDRKILAAQRLDIERRPRCPQAVGNPLRIADKPSGVRIFADTDKNAFTGWPRPFDGMGLHMRKELLVDTLGRAAKSEFAKRRQIARREVILKRPLGFLRDIDLALAKPLHQLVRRKVDDFNIVGSVEDAIGNRFPDADAGNLLDNVVEAFNVLDVQRRIDIDPGGKQLFHVEIALGVPAAGCIRMGEFVDKRQFRAAGKKGVEVHFVEHPPFVLDGLARDNLQTVKQGFRFGPAMGLHDAGHHVVSGG